VCAYGHGFGLRMLGGMMSTWNFRAASLAAVTIMVLAGCTTRSSDATFAALGSKSGDITVAAIPSVDLAGLYVAQDDGLFARQGLHVTIRKIPSSKAVIAAQLQGQVDISAGSYVGYIAAQAAGPGSASSPKPPPCGRTRGR
jgi:NitT/TauT family transport system substrate-binding protein